jgi:hypothetical protein
MYAADSSFYMRLLRVGLLVNASLKRCRFMWPDDAGFNPSTQRHYRRLIYLSSIYIYKNVCLCICVCVCVCPGITLERLERFRPNLAHTLLYACARIVCIFYIYVYFLLNRA